ncbi:MAG: CehA/McbA family metallohydrolase [Ignavibacteriales bacterium]|nr:CehA/McbA family metallohydrolase [Ignavibacteriales bacterium]
MFPLQDLWILPAFLYAETHYRFPYCFSLLKTREPEVIADAPHRLEPNHHLPVMILVKDAHLYPATLAQIRIKVSQDNRLIQSSDHLEKPIELRERISWHLIHLDLSGLAGWVDIDVEFTLECRGRSRTYHNDNHRTSSRKPLRVYLAKDSLPRFDDLYLGDPHTHSHFTDDQVEFGIPLFPAITLAKALGLAYYAVTDHSYDLDDDVDSYLTNDPTLAKWRQFQAEVDHLNSRESDFVVVRGEEVSCRNSDEKNVHLLVMGQREFIYGSGDGAERWNHTTSEHSAREVLAIKSADSPAFAAHAKEPVPFLQRLLLGRGVWTDADLALDALTGLQILNGRCDESFWEGYRAWTRQLLKGKKLIAIAGNDAHGNFNRFRQIGIPFLLIKENNDQIFGKMRTGLFVNGGLSEQNVLQAFESGSAIMTDGPVIRLIAVGGDHSQSGIGGSVTGPTIRLELDVLSTPEFGEIGSVKLILGKIGDSTERTAYRIDGNNGFLLRKEFSVNPSGACYARAEVWTIASNSFDGQEHYCLTNPIWIRSA